MTVPSSGLLRYGDAEAVGDRGQGLRHFRAEAINNKPGGETACEFAKRRCYAHNGQPLAVLIADFAAAMAP